MKSMFNVMTAQNNHGLLMQERFKAEDTHVQPALDSNARSFWSMWVLLHASCLRVRSVAAFFLSAALAAALMFTVPASAAEFLEAEQAFPVSVSGQGDEWVVEFRVAQGYYLYRDRLDVKRPEGRASAVFPRAGAGGATSISSSGVAEPPQLDIPPGKRKFDENLGKEVETLRDVVRIAVRWTDTPPEAVDIHSQGCADAGLCYPPMVQTIKLNSASAHFPAAGSTRASSDSGFFAGLNFVSPRGSSDQSGALAKDLQTGNSALVLMAFFGLGLLLAFTPCVLPMVPILSAVIVGQQGQQTQQGSRWRSVALALAYVAGMSLVYTLVGIAAGLTGEGLVAAMQTPAVLYSFAAFLLVFGIAMLGAWEMQLPLSVQNWVNERSSRLQGGQFAPVFVMGGLSAVLVGPCVAPPLAGALLYLSTTGDWVLGGAALMSLSWGLGAPLIVAAAAADRILPRAGVWMESVKRFFGFLLIALAIYTAAPVLSVRVLMSLWCIFLLASAAWAGALQVLPAQAGALSRLRQGFAWVLLVAGVLQGVGAAAGATDVFNPLAPFTNAAGVPVQNQAAPGANSATVAAEATFANPHGLPFRRVAAKDVEQTIANLRQPVMLDFYADWCVSCKEMERFTFTDADVQKALSTVVWLQVDVTGNTSDDKALLKRFRLFGPPGIVFFDANGQEIQNVRVVGFQNAKQFEQTVRAAFGTR